MSMFATPSSRYQVLPWRPPPTEAPDSVGKELLVVSVEAWLYNSLVVPTAKLTRLEGSRPFKGRSFTSSSSMTWPISAVVVFSCSARPVTVKVS